MRIKLFFVSFLAIFITSNSGIFAHDLDHSKPMMLKDKNYTEYWEQFFYLSDGSLVTSQFLIANFPWPVGKDHGIMLGTLVTPEGELHVIKNGRDLGKWGYNENALDLFIHTHRLKAFKDDYSVHLENTMGVVDLQLKSDQPAVDHKSFSSKNGFIEASFYAPSLTGSGNWQLGPEAGFDPAGPVHNIDYASGFGTHVVMTDKVDNLIKYWSRIIGVGREGIKPFLSSITRPNSDVDTILKLFDGNQELDNFEDVDITYDNITSEKDASYPQTINISATSEKGSLKGSFKYTKKLAHFNLTEHLNFFEKSFAKSNPSVTNFRYLVDYNLVYKTEEGEKTLTGKALSEYTDIMPAKKAPAKKRRRNRR